MHAALCATLTRLNARCQQIALEPGSFDGQNDNVLVSRQIVRGQPTHQARVYRIASINDADSFAARAASDVCVTSMRPYIGSDRARRNVGDEFHIRGVEMRCVFGFGVGPCCDCAHGKNQCDEMSRSHLVRIA
jgi:hypothetical protein